MLHSCTMDSDKYLVVEWCGFPVGCFQVWTICNRSKHAAASQMLPSWVQQSFLFAVIVLLALLQLTLPLMPLLCCYCYQGMPGIS